MFPNWWKKKNKKRRGRESKRKNCVRPLDGPKKTCVWSGKGLGFWVQSLFLFFKYFFNFDFCSVSDGQLSPTILSSVLISFSAYKISPGTCLDAKSEHIGEPNILYLSFPNHFYQYFKIWNLDTRKNYTT